MDGNFVQFAAFILRRNIYEPSTSKPEPSKPKGGDQKTTSLDYLKSIDVDSSYANREKLAKQHGIRNYTGIAAQNMELLKKISG